MGKHINLPATPPLSEERRLQHPADNRGPLLNKLGRNSRGANTADPEIEHRQASLPPYIEVATGSKHPVSLSDGERGTSGRG